MESTKNLLICLCLIIAVTLTQAQNTRILENAECKLRKVIVPVDDIHDPLSTYVPSAVELHQCGGSHDGNHGCAAVKTELVNARVEVFTKHGERETRDKTFLNHTACEMRCSCNTRLHECADTDKYIIPCPEGSQWSFDECRCLRIVGCNKQKDEDDEVSISLTMFILALVIEFVVVLIALFLIMDACKNRRRESGILHKTAEFVRSLSVRSHDGPIGLRKDRSNTGSESFLNTYSASNGRIDTV